MKKIVQLRIFQLLIVVFISAFVGYFIGTNSVKIAFKEYKPVLSVTSKNPPAGENLDMSLFYQVLDKVNENYYDKSKINSTKLLEGAINGMLATLSDPYTSFFPPVKNTEFKNQLAGQFSGIGAELSMSPENVITVVAPIDGSPAQKAGYRDWETVSSHDMRSER